MMPGFLAWWLRQLSELLPARVRAEEPDGLSLALLDEGGVEATRRTGRRSVALGRFALDAAGLSALKAAVRVKPRAVRLLIPARLLLRREVSLPLAAEGGLGTALRWEMDRLTPFAADAVFWHWRVERRDRAHGTVLVSLLLVPKAAIGAVLAALERAGLAPASLVSLSAPGDRVPLAQAARRGVRLTPILAGAVVLAAVGATAAPFVQQAREFRRVERQGASLRPAAEVAEGLRRRLADRAASDNVMAQESARVGQALQVLALVTGLLPDGTYLSNFGLRDGMLAVSGESGSAAGLIAAFAGSAALQNPRFAAPVMRNESSKLESFSIRAELRQ